MEELLLDRRTAQVSAASEPVKASIDDLVQGGASTASTRLGDIDGSSGRHGDYVTRPRGPHRGEQLHVRQARPGQVGRLRLM